MALSCIYIVCLKCTINCSRKLYMNLVMNEFNRFKGLCSFNFIMCWCIRTSKYLNELHSCADSQKSEGCHSYLFLCWLQILCSLFYEYFKKVCLLITMLKHTFIQNLMLSLQNANKLQKKGMLASSAKRINSNKVEDLTTSFILEKGNNGSKVEPLGTPVFRIRISEIIML